MVARLPPRRDGLANPGSDPRAPGRIVDRFDQCANRCASANDLKELIDAAARELGFRYFALVHHASLRDDARSGLIRLDNYPSGWEEELVSGGLVSDDPVHAASARCSIGFAWEELGDIVMLTRPRRRVLERSRRHGIGEGFTVPVCVPGEPLGSCSFATARRRGLPRRRLICAESIGAHAFRAARRIWGYPAQARLPHLSRRELQCLRLLARGKTDWEISVVLGISIETARQYTKRARKAYDVCSRTQLVAHGLRDGLIDFEDAIPPPG